MWWPLSYQLMKQIFFFLYCKCVYPVCEIPISTWGAGRHSAFLIVNIFKNWIYIYITPSILLWGFKGVSWVNRGGPNPQDPPVFCTLCMRVRIAALAPYKTWRHMTAWRPALWDEATRCVSEPHLLPISSPSHCLTQNTCVFKRPRRWFEMTKFFFLFESPLDVQFNPTLEWQTQQSIPQRVEWSGSCYIFLSVRVLRVYSRGEASFSMGPIHWTWFIKTDNLQSAPEWRCLCQANGPWQSSNDDAVIKQVWQCVVNLRDAVGGDTGFTSHSLTGSRR